MIGVKEEKNIKITMTIWGSEDLTASVGKFGFSLGYSVQSKDFWADEAFRCYSLALDV